MHALISTNTQLGSLFCFALPPRKMGKLMLVFFFFSLCMLFHVNYCASNFSSFSPVPSPKTCPPDESIALLQFKYSISIGDVVNNGICDDGSYPKTNTWQQGADCCSWDGVECDVLTGHVIGLDLSCSRLNGSIRSNSSLFHLSHLQTLNLAHNFFSSPIPHEISYLGSDGLHVDNYAFQNLIRNLTKLKALDLSWSDMSLVESKSLLNISSTLRSLRLSDCFLNGEIPDDFSRFSLLEELDLKENQFVGQIPDVFGNLTKLNTLFLASNNFVGPVPFSVFNLTQLLFIDLSYNQINGSFPNNVSGLSYLLNLDFSYNQLNGKIPSWLFTIPSLSILALRNNKFTGCFPIHPLQQPNSLTFVYLSNNEIHGPIQNPIFELVSLQYLDLSFNNLSDIEWNMLQKLKYLRGLLLSHNSQLSLRGRSSSVNPTLPNLVWLDLTSCNISEFPDFLHTLENLNHLYLSNNRIHGRIPRKQGLEGWKKLQFLYLSNNSLTGLEQHPWKNIVVLDLSSNLIQGPLPVPPGGINVFTISKNNLSGPISSSICICSSLKMLDLSDNRLNGAIPRCLGNFRNLQILNLQNNNFHGSIPDAFANGSSLWYVNLNGNQFERQLPRSLVNCSLLEILDLRNNKINDTFPYWLGTLRQLKVLILRSNNFHGVISLPKKTKFIFEELQLLDLSHNQFNGILPITLLGNLKSMMNVDRDHGSKVQYLGDDQAYQVGVETNITMKGSEFGMPKILVIFKHIDFSNNRFEGEIPEVVCKFKSLKILNFSHNNLGGHIPSSFGNLTGLESLDLSSNKLVGQIPQQLAVLTSLAVLNLSYNLLTGPIPVGSQLSTFSNDSYIGNSGLCGFPLSKKCDSEAPPPPPSAEIHEEDDSTSWFDWKIMMMGYGCGVVIGLSIGYIVFTTGKPWWFVKMVEKKQDKIVRRINQRRRGGRKVGNPRGRQ